MPPTDPLAWAVAAFRDDRGARYRTYEAYAAGDQPTAASPASAVGPLGKLLVAMTYNRCAAVVDAIADRLTIAGFRDADGPGDAGAAMAVWRANRMDKREGELYQEALTTGDAYAIVWPDPETGEPTIWPQDASAVRVRYDDERPGRVVLAAKLWRQADDALRLNLYLPDRLEKYVSRTRSRAGLPSAAGAFARYRPDGDLGWPLPYAWFRADAPSIPVFHFANNARTGRYGTSELRDVLPIQDALNKSVTDLLKGSELGGHPQKWGSGVESDQEAIVVGVDRMLTAPQPDARFGTFAATDLQQLVAVVNQFDLMIARTSRVPVRYLAATGADASGEAKKMDDDPFVRKIVDRQVAFGNVWEDALTLALRMQGIELAFGLEASWEPAAPRSDRERAELAVLYRQAGLPLPAILREIGLTDAEIATVLGEQADAVERARAAFDAGEDDLADGRGAADAAA